MLNAMQFVSGCIGAHDYVPTLEYVLVKDGRIQAFNGVLHASAPVPDAFAQEAYCVKGEQFLHALRTAAARSKTGFYSVQYDAERGRVKVTARGAFTATLRTIPVEQFNEEAYHDNASSADKVDGEELLEALAYVRPLVSTDASRPWAHGVRIGDGVAAATNNVAMVQTPVSTALSCILPVAVVDELLRTHLPPRYARVQEHCVELWFDDGRFLRSRRVHGDWPKGPAEILHESVTSASAWIDVPRDALLEALREVEPFVHDARVPVVTLTGNTVAVMGVEDHGASVELQELNCPTVLHARVDLLYLVLPLIEQWCVSGVPRVVFMGARGAQGAFMGVSA